MIIACLFVPSGAGLTAGLSGLSAGYAVGQCGHDGVKGSAIEPRFFTGMILNLVFAGVSGLYGMLIAIMLLTNRAK